MHYNSAGGIVIR